MQSVFAPNIIMIAWPLAIGQASLSKKITFDQIDHCSFIIHFLDKSKGKRTNMFQSIVYF